MKYKEIILLEFLCKPTNYCNPTTLGTVPTRYKATSLFVEQTQYTFISLLIVMFKENY